MLFLARDLERADIDAAVKLLHGRRRQGVLYAIEATAVGWSLLASVPDQAPAEVKRVVAYMFSLLSGERA